MFFRATVKFYGVWRGEVMIFIEHIPHAGHFGDTLQELALIPLINLMDKAF